MTTLEAQQMVFDKALAHLRTQGQKSMGPMGCSYRGIAGARCAIGTLIADSDYCDDMEGQAADGILVQIRLPEYAQEAGPNFLMDVQWALHDALTTMEPFLPQLERGARDLARNYGLTYTVPKETP